MRKCFILLFTIVVALFFGGITASRSLYKHKQVQPGSGSQAQAVDDSPLLAATYFGSAWPLNFWNSSFSNTEKDMEIIKNDGFNSILLVLPWGEFQPRISPIKYNESAFKRLNYLLKEAKRHELKVILRLSYSWDFDPDDQMPNVERFQELYTNPKVFDAWLSYLGKIYKAVKRDQNVKLSFITWEDLWCVEDKASNLKTDSERLAFGKKNWI